MKTATQSSYYGSWSSVIGVEPVTSFDLRLDQIDLNSYVGLSPRSSFTKDGFNRGYFLRVADGYTATHVNNDSKGCYGAAFARAKNGEDLGMAFTVPDPSVPWFPLITMYERGQVTSVD
ncbi:Aste57867_19502 [Aphanomyces stellatus]|uniref:Aste57867_19502 protein n=1 Tax=Aphanomyces stellatus TaxID=120398 RepID=A0A485LCW0_9STRA|nr:hypothetical protein As57867_019438 [Aphanomyces stellatus]VFT96212.1 Aste57867_19502 [Aphanomyces stellatus]